MKKLNLAWLQPEVYTLGPGKRFGIWTQGCPFNCKNCISPKWKEFKYSIIVKVIELAKFMLKFEFEGVTISGGEPFIQASSLTELLKITKQVKNYNVIVFTGYNYKDLKWDSAIQFLKYIDVLIAGPYIKELDNKKGLRGSENQEIIFLTEKLKKYKNEFYYKPRRLIFNITETNISFTGIPEDCSIKFFTNLNFK